jgi:hypothetical protein
VALLPYLAHSADLISGDQLLDEDHLEVRDSGDSIAGEGSPTASVNGFIHYKSKPWPGGVIPIEIHKSLSELHNAEYKIKKFYKACEYWSSVANVKCVPRNKQKDYVELRVDKKGCYTHVGYKPGKISVLNLQKDGCWLDRIIYHEIGHVLGLLHEHQRSDRHRYIKINWQNVLVEKHGFFSILTSNLEKTKYDFDSIMHYGHKNFSRNGEPTIEIKDQYKDKAKSVTGYRFNLKPSEEDLKVIARFYGENPNPPKIIKKIETKKVTPSKEVYFDRYRLPYHSDIHHRY